MFKDKINFENFDDIKSKINVRKILGSVKDILIYFLCAFMASSKLISGATPFGIAMFAAINTINVPLIIPFLIIAIITGVFFGNIALVKFLIAGILYVAIKSFLRLENTKISNTGIILFSTLISEIVGLSINGLLLYDALFAVYNSIMVGIFYLMFCEGLPVLYNIDKAKIYSTESLICMGVIVSILVSSFGGVGIAGITLRGTISILSVMVLGWKLGSSIGATSGLIISLSMGLMGFGNVATVATYAFCGLLAGMLSKFGKWGAVIGFVLGNIILVFFANGSTEVLISIKEIVLASLVLFLIPKKLLVILDDLFDYNRALPGEGVAGYIEENTIFKLSAVSEVINDMADNVSANRDDIPTDQIGSFIKTLNENTCKRCQNYEKCWKENYHKMYEETFNAIEKLQGNNVITERDLKDSICTQKALFAEGLNLCFEIYKVNKEWQAKVKEQRIQMAMQLKEVSQEIDKMKNNIKGNLNKENIEDSVANEIHTLELGIAKTKKTNSIISGDSNTVIKLKDGKILVAISDGMGSGEIAARNSKKVVLNLEKLLNTGFEEDRAIKMINSYMLVGKNPDNFATIDAMIFDPLVGLTEFIKIGACPTFISTRDGQFLTVESNSLPAGILGDIEIETKTRLLKRDDLIVMVSDGIIDGMQENQIETMKKLLLTVKNITPQRLADIILQETIDSNFGIAKDDMTVIVAKVI